MRTLLTLAACAVLALMVGAQVARASGDGNGIVHSPHDFTDNTYNHEEGLSGNIENDDAEPAAWNNNRKEICRVCHVPHDHGHVAYSSDGLLWNHALSTKTTWTMYTNALPLANLEGAVAAEPQGTSKLCLGCHDGVSAINEYDGKTPANAGYGNGTTYLMGDFDAGYAVGNTGSDSLTRTHPISITYNTADAQLHDPTGATMDNGDTVTSLLVDGRVECSTCHDVHNRESVGGTHLLRESTKGADVTGDGASALCLVCHDK